MCNPVLRTGVGVGSSAIAQPVSQHLALFDEYCLTCHDERLRTAGLVLSQMDLEQVGADAENWEKVVRKLRAETMPPAGRPRPDKATYTALTSWLEAALDRAAPTTTPERRRFAVHRLNRIEYGHAIRDLLGLDIDTEVLLPPDDEDEGFDNVADILSVSPTLMERYLSAARRVSQLAVGDPDAGSVAEIYRVPESLVQDDRTSDNLPLGSRGGVAIRQYFPLDGDYSIRIRLRRSFYDVVRGLGTVSHQLDVRVDGALVKRFSVGGEHQGRKPPASHSGNTRGDEAWEVYSHHADDDLEARVLVKAGRATGERREDLCGTTLVFLRAARRGSAHEDLLAGVGLRRCDAVDRTTDLDAAHRGVSVHHLVHGAGRRDAAWVL